MQPTLRSFDLAHLGHVELLTPKPEHSLRFFVDVMGMTESGRQGASVYLRGWDDYERHTPPADRPPADGRTRFDVPGLGELRIAFSPAMGHMQFWSQPGKDFVCLEPFWGPNDTVNTERRLEVAPGSARELWMRLELA